jgi:hypothetical protein
MDMIVLAKRKGKIERLLENWKTSGIPHLVGVANDVDSNMRCNKPGRYRGTFSGTDKKMAFAS